MEAARQDRAGRLVVLVAGLVATAVYLGTIGNGWVLDDLPAIVRNPAAQPPIDLRAIATTNYWGSPRDYAHLTIYRPLATLSFAVGALVHGPAPWGVHLGNALLHGLVSALVALLGLRLARVLGRSREAVMTAGATGLLFAVHPLHTEAVAGAVSRAELLAALFVVATLLLALRWRDGGRWRRLAGGGAVAAFALALLSKENAVTALPMLLVVEAGLAVAAWRSGQPAPRPRGAWPLLLTLVAVLGAYLALRAVVLPGVLGGVVPRSDNPIVGTDGAARWLTPFAVYLEAWRLLVWPVGLSVDYTAHALPLAAGWGDPRGLAGLGLFVATLTAAVWAARRRPDVAVALGLFLAAYSVMSHLAFPATVIFGERLLYLPSVGVCLLVGQGVAPLLAPTRARAVRIGALVAGLALLGAAAAGTLARTRDWKDERTLYLTSAAHTPGSSRLQNNLGRWLLEDGDVRRARAAFETAVQIDSGNFSAWSNLGRAHMALGDGDGARAAFRRALALKSDLVAALNNLCVLERKAGAAEAALVVCRDAVRHAPGVPTVRANLVRALAAAGRDQEACAALAALVAEAPALAAALREELAERPSGPRIGAACPAAPPASRGAP